MDDPVQKTLENHFELKDPVEQFVSNKYGLNRNHLQDPKIREQAELEMFMIRYANQDDYD